MIRVLMIGPDRSVHGGISGVVNNYYDAGLDKKIELIYIGTMVEGSKFRKLLKAAAAYVRFLSRLPFCEIVHVNMASDNSYRRKAVFIRTAKLFSKKIVIHQHGGDFESFYEKQSTKKGRESIRKVLQMGDAFLVLAPAWKDFFANIIGEDHITVLPDSIAIPRPYEKQYSGHRVLFLGRLCREKGIGELLASVPALAEKFPDFHLYLGGIWEDEELRRMAEKNREFVTWLGWISGSEKQKWLSVCEAFVLPSYFEGQSVSVLEAMANYCGIVASNTGGIPQMIIDEKTGLLVTPKDTASLEQGLMRILGDAGLCRQLGRAARDKVEREFEIGQNIERLLKIYQEVLER